MRLRSLMVTGAGLPMATIPLVGLESATGRRSPTIVVVVLVVLCGLEEVDRLAALNPLASKDLLFRRVFCFSLLLLVFLPMMASRAANSDCWVVKDPCLQRLGLLVLAFSLDFFRSFRDLCLGRSGCDFWRLSRALRSTRPTIWREEEVVREEVPVRGASPLLLLLGGANASLSPSSSCRFLLLELLEELRLLGALLVTVVTLLGGDWW